MVKILSKSCLGLEFIGMAIITMSYNMTIGGYPGVLFIATLWAWNLGAAHYNMAISLGACIYASDSIANFTQNACEFLVLILVQFLGALFGVLLTF